MKQILIQEKQEINSVIPRPIRKNQENIVLANPKIQVLVFVCTLTCKFNHLISPSTFPFIFLLSTQFGLHKISLFFYSRPKFKKKR